MTDATAFPTHPKGSKESFLVGDAITFDLEIKNVDAKVIQVEPIKCHNLALDHDGYKEPILQFNYSFADASVHVRQFSGKALDRHLFVACGSKYEGALIDLEPNRSTFFPIQVTRSSVALPAGEYEIHVRYHAANLLKGFGDRPTTNTIRFTVHGE